MGYEVVIIGKHYLDITTPILPSIGWSNALTIESEEMTLGFVFVDYVRHMAHHLRHIGAPR